MNFNILHDEVKSNKNRIKKSWPVSFLASCSTLMAGSNTHTHIHKNTIYMAFHRSNNQSFCFISWTSYRSFERIGGFFLSTVAINEKKGKSCTIRINHFVDIRFHQLKRIFLLAAASTLFVIVICALLHSRYRNKFHAESVNSFYLSRALTHFAFQYSFELPLKLVPFEWRYSL